MVLHRYAVTYFSCDMIRSHNSDTPVISYSPVTPHTHTLETAQSDKPDTRGEKHLRS